jgi:NADH:ubiquinone oxidoreductase subunit 2 (subunit N)
MLQLTYNSLLLIFPLSLILVIFMILVVFKYNIRFVFFTKNIFILTFFSILVLLYNVHYVYCYNTIYFSFINIDIIFLSLLFLSVCFVCFFMFNFYFIMEEIILLISLLFISIFAISAVNFISLFVCFESLNICFFILILSSTNDARSVEAAIKYIFISMIASLVFLLGIVFIYLTWMSFSYSDLLLYFSYTSVNEIDFEIVLGFFFVMLTFFIKLGIFPFYNWMVVVYSNLAVKPLIIVVCLIKFIFSLILIKLITTFFVVFNSNLYLLLFIGALGSFSVGCFYLLNEIKTKSYIAFLSPTSTGFLLMFLCSSNTEFLYVFSYLHVMTQAFTFVFFFGFLSFLKSKNDLPVSVDQLRNYAEINFSFLIFFIFTLFSFIGIPPFPGFFPKVAMLYLLFYNNNFVLLFFSIMFTLIMSFCLFRMIVVISKNNYQTGLFISFQSYKGYVWLGLYVLFSIFIIIIHYNLYVFYI